MQLTTMANRKIDFDQKALKTLLETETKFLSNLFDQIAFPPVAASDDEDSADDGASQTNSSAKPTLLGPKKSRALSIADLQQRLQDMQGPKRNLSYKDKLVKKGLKNRMKKKSKQDERNQQQKLIRAEKLSQKVSIEATVTSDKPEKPKPSVPKPVFNVEGKMVFSKFDFSGLGAAKARNVEKDPKKLLKILQQQKDTIAKLEAEGKQDKAIEFKEKAAWKNAIAKVQGEKVRDDPDMLKKTVKRQELQHKKSKKKWEARVAGVKNAQEERQKKRSDNIEKRKKDKKASKNKKAVKRGKVIPGF